MERVDCSSGAERRASDGVVVWVGRLLLVAWLLVVARSAYAEALPAGTALDPFSSLHQLESVAAGHYHFDLEGQAFSADVDADGWLLVAIEFGNSTGAMPASSAMDLSTTGILPPEILASLSETAQVRMQDSTGVLDVQTDDTRVRARVLANQPLFRGAVDNALNDGWQGAGEEWVQIDSPNSGWDTNDAKTLSEAVFHALHSPLGLHWMPWKNEQRLYYDAGEIADEVSLRLWVRADFDSRPLISAALGTQEKPFTDLSQAHRVQVPGMYYFSLDGEQFASHVEVGGWVMVVNETEDVAAAIPDRLSLSSSQRGILTEPALASLVDARRVRMVHSNGGVDAISANRQHVARILANFPLNRGAIDNAINDSWVGTGASSLTIDSPSTQHESRPLNVSVFHAFHEAGGMHWIPFVGESRLTYDMPDVQPGESLRLWVQADENPQEPALWMRADQGLDESAGAVTDWSDVARAGRSAQAVQGDPTLSYAGFNGNPAVDFDGDDAVLVQSTPLLPAADAAEVFYVLKRRDGTGYPGEIAGRVDGPDSGTHYRWSGNAHIFSSFGRDTRFSWLPSTPPSGSEWVDPDHINLLNLRSTLTEWVARFNGTVQFQSTEGAPVFDQTQSGDVVVGAASGSAFDGQIAEVLVFGDALDDAQRDVVESYLAIKYGIPLSQHSANDYVDSRGQVVWSAVANQGYPSAVAGLARDDAVGLDQRVSAAARGDVLQVALEPDFSSANTAVVRTIAHANDRQYLLVSHDGADTQAVAHTDLPTGYGQRLAREWRVSSSANFQQVISLRFANLPPGDWVLLADADGDFRAGASALATSGNGEFHDVSLGSAVFFTLASANRPPTISGVPLTTVDEDSAYAFEPTAADPDGQTLVFSAQNLPTWLSVDTATGRLFGTPTNADVGVSQNILVQVSDGHTQVALPAFDIAVANVNDPPEVIIPPVDVAVQAGVLWELQLPVGMFADPDVGDTLNYQIDGAPAWLQFDAAARRFSGTPSVGDVAASSVRIEVRDALGAVASATFSLTVVADAGLLRFLLVADSVLSGDATLDDLRDALVALAVTGPPDGLLGALARALGESPKPVDAASLQSRIDAVERNAADHPVLYLTLHQGGGAVSQIRAGDGEAQVELVLANPESGVLSSIDWSASDEALRLLESGPPSVGPSLRFDPASLSADQNLVARVAVERLGWQAVAEMVIRVSAADGSLADADDDGVPDSLEDGLNGHADPDNLGLLQTQSGNGSGFVMQATPGTRLRLGHVARATLLGAASVDAEAIERFALYDTGRLLSTADAPISAFDFEVANLPYVGASVSVVLPLRHSLAEGAGYYKYDPVSGWISFVEDAFNKVSSAPAVDALSGLCPPPGHRAYRRGLNEGDRCVELVIQDGGPNDADRRGADNGLNGNVVDPGAIFQSPQAAEPVRLITGLRGVGSLSVLFVVSLGLLGASRYRQHRGCRSRLSSRAFRSCQRLTRRRVG